MLFIKTQERQQQIEPLGCYMVSHQGYDEDWGCTSTANNEHWFSGGEDDEGILEDKNKDEDKRDERNKLNSQEMDDCNNIMLPHPGRGGLEGGRLGMKRNK